MSDIEQVQPGAAVPVEEKKGGGLGAAVVGLGAGATTAYFVDKNQKKKFVERMMGAEPVAELKEKIGKATGEAKTKLETELKDLEALRKDNPVIKKILDKKETQELIATGQKHHKGAETALGLIQTNADAVKVEVHGKGLKVTPKSYTDFADKAAAEAAGLRDIKIDADKVTGGHFEIHAEVPKGLKGELTEDAIKGLRTVETGAAKDAKPWIETAAAALKKESAAIEKTAVTKGAGFGFGLKNASTGGKVLAGAAIVAAAAVGYKVITALGGGKHTNAVNNGRANEQNAGMGVA